MMMSKHNKTKKVKREKPFFSISHKTGKRKLFACIMNDGAVIVLCNRQSFNLGEQTKQKKYLYLTKRRKTFCRCDR